MPDGDIYECNVDQTYNGQNLTNVLHFTQVGTDGTGGARQGLSEVWQNEFQQAHLDLLVEEVVIVQLRIRKLLPTQTQQLIVPIGDPGAVLTDGLPPQQCAILQQKAERGGPKGRRGAGHMKISGVPIGNTDAGRINLNYANDMNVLGLIFAATHTDAPSGYTFEPSILSMVDNIARPIINSGSSSRIRTVYSRSIGVGQ